MQDPGALGAAALRSLSCGRQGHGVPEPYLGNVLAPVREATWHPQSTEWCLLVLVTGAPGDSALRGVRDAGGEATGSIGHADTSTSRSHEAGAPGVVRVLVGRRVVTEAEKGDAASGD